MNCCGGSSRHSPRVSGALFIFADGYCFLLFFSTLFRGYNFLWEECPLFSSRFPILHMCPGRLITSICMRVLIGPFTPTSFSFLRPFIPITYSPLRINHAHTIIPSRFLTCCHVTL